jgi:LPS O-antigen subunit length determinant protein (WzzB/FepE family)
MDDRELDLSTFIGTLWNRRKFIIFFIFICTVISIIVSLLLPKWYKAEAVVLSPQSSEMPISPAGLLSELGMGTMLGSNENVFRYLAILKSRTLKEAVVKQFDLQSYYKSKNIDKAIEKFEDNTILEVGEEYQIKISLIDKGQNLVADVVNYTVHCLDSLNIVLSTNEAKNNREFMEIRIAEVMDSLRYYGESLAKFMKDNKILSIEEQVTAGIEQLALIKSQIIQKEVELEVAQKSLKSTNPIVKLTFWELNELRKQYHDLMSNKSLESIAPDFKKIPDLQLRLVELQRKVEYYSKLVEFLGPQYEQLKLEEAKSIPTLQILDKAVMPENKYKPKRSIIVIIVFLLSCFVGSAYVLIKERKKGNYS